MEPLDRELRAAFNRVLDRGWFLMGPEVDAFEKEFAEWLGMPFTVSVNSGTDALILSLRALGLKQDDEVICPSFTAMPCWQAIAAAGCVPVFAEVEQDLYTLDPKNAEELIGPKTKAVLAVHLYGQPCDMRGLTKLCRDKGLFLIEDCAQAHGAAYRGKPTGTFGDLSAFSFYPTKNLGALGDAGAVCGKSSNLEKKLRLLRQYGEEERYKSVSFGKNSRMDELQAAFLRVRLPKLLETRAERRALAHAYMEGLTGLPVVTPVERKDCGHAYHLFVIRAKARDELAAHLAQKNIGTAVHYPLPGHTQPVFANDPGLCRTGDLTYTENLTREILSLPFFPGMKPRDAEMVCAAIQEFYNA
ncbi:MAG: DegT/DnrJ/EryC1/StrS family aminotransferase [Thermodesulfobacteriota bacterium]|nr:DegT/DnrJ/EryC1/StrS family aminotransferase [Thermodesulfobacteriota bacterium]